MHKISFFAENCLAADAVKEVELLKVFVIQVFILVLILILQILVLLIKDDLGFSNLLPFGCLVEILLPVLAFAAHCIVSSISTMSPPPSILLVTFFCALIQSSLM